MDREVSRTPMPAEYANRMVCIHPGTFSFFSIVFLPLFQSEWRNVLRKRDGVAMRWMEFGLLASLQMELNFLKT